MSSHEEEEEEEETAVVIDNGTHRLRAGLAGDDAPRLIWRNLTATPKSEVQMLSMSLKERYIGDEAQLQRERLNLHYPMKGGQVTDWDAMEQIWEATFRELNSDPTQMPVLMSDRPLIPLKHRERMTEMMMETFQVPRFYVMSQGVLTMFSTGRGTTVMVDCGEGATTAMPSEFLTIRPHAILRGEVSGADLTAYLQSLMMEKRYDVSGPEGLESLREVKESLCYVAEDYRAELSKCQEAQDSLEKRYELPDGQRITLKEARFRVPEAMFQPYLLGKSGDGIHEVVYNSIMKCDIDSRRDFYANIILAGGSTCFPGFKERLQKEISVLAPPTMNVKVVCPPSSERKIAAWIGGSIVASLSCFQNSWITQQDYEEHGPAIVHKKCT